jgi:hypothetical protein
VPFGFSQAAFSQLLFDLVAFGEFSSKPSGEAARAFEPKPLPSSRGSAGKS